MTFGSHATLVFLNKYFIGVKTVKTLISLFLQREAFKLSLVTIRANSYQTRS